MTATDPRVAGTLVGLVFAAGVLLVVRAFSARRATDGPRRASGLRRMLAEAGLADLAPARLVLLSAGGALGGLLAGLIVTAVPVVGLLAAATGAAVPFAWVRRRARLRQRALRAAWPDVVDALVSAVRAGMPLADAVADLARRGPAVLAPAFEAFDVHWRATGSFDRGVDALVTWCADPVADRVAACLRVAREVGGTDLGRVLRGLAVALREDLRLRGELEARQAWTVSAARLAVAAPWITVALLSTRPEGVRAYASPEGAALLLGAAAATVLGYVVMRRIARLPEPSRLLA